MDDLERIVGGLRPSEKHAIAVLEKHGWAVMYDCKIEDGRNPDGTRRRTFMRAARHDLVLMLKKADGREPPSEPAQPEQLSEGVQPEEPKQAESVLTAEPKHSRHKKKHK